MSGTTNPGIGDIASNDKGSGARFNSGKPDLSLIPLTLLATYYRQSHPDSIYVEALSLLGLFQSTHNTRYLLSAFEALGDGWADCAKVFGYGKRKYAAWNWAKGMPWSVPLACASRHLLALIRGEDMDPESGENHRGHVFCNLVMLMTYAQTYHDGNDLPAVGMLP